MDQGSNKNHSPAYNFAPTVTKFCVMWEGLSLPHDTKFGNCRCKIVDSRSFPSWSLIHGLRWSSLIKVGPGWSFHLLPQPYNTSIYVSPHTCCVSTGDNEFYTRWHSLISPGSSLNHSSSVFPSDSPTMQCGAVKTPYVFSKILDNRYPISHFHRSVVSSKS